MVVLHMVVVLLVFVLKLDKGNTIYIAGDTNVFSGMSLIKELYRPNIACLPIGDVYTMGPREVAKAVELLEPEIVVPMHYGTFDALTGSPDELKKLTSGSHTKINVLNPRDTMSIALS